MPGCGAAGGPGPGGAAPGGPGAAPRAPGAGRGTPTVLEVSAGRGRRVTLARPMSELFVASPDIDFHWFPLANPGLVSIPLGFLFAVLGTLTSKELDRAKQAEMEVRSLTGAHAEKAAGH